MYSTKFVVLSALFAVSLAASAEHHEVVPIVSLESDIEPSGQYHFSYESGDGSKVSQEGIIKTVDKEEVEVAQGEYSYKSADDGKVYGVRYVADENGYQPEGEHLPTPPPVPKLIAKALDYLATAPPPKAEVHH